MCADSTHRASEISRPELETVRVLIKGVDEKIRALDERTKLVAEEAEKRYDHRFEAAEKAVSTALASAEKAVTKAEAAAEKRFESQNEFRQTLTDQAGTFLTRNEYTVQHSALIEKVDDAGARISAVETMVNDIRARGSGRNDIWLILVGASSIAIALASLMLHWKGG